MKVCHITSVHPRYDSRIFYKECVSLSKAGYETFLLVADGKGDEEKNNVKIIDIGLRETNRLKRSSVTGKKIMKKAVEIDADIYHFHDPELLLHVNLLHKKGKKIIFDVHEDVPKQLLTKGYLNPKFSNLISKFYAGFEKKKSAKLSAIVCAEPEIAKRFKTINKNTVEVRNYPILGEFPQINWEKRQNNVCYVGGISGIRGIKEIVKAIEKVDAKLLLAGNFSPETLKDEVSTYEGWSKVEFYGFVGRKEIAEILSISKIGLVLLHPIPKYLEAYPVKMFEYMAAGLPILASDFDLYKEILDDAKCGITVNPLDVDEIAEAMTKMLNDDEMLKQMSINGQKAAKEKYNWGTEEKKLLELYQKLQK